MVRMVCMSSEKRDRTAEGGTSNFKNFIISIFGIKF